MFTNLMIRVESGNPCYSESVDNLILLAKKQIYNIEMPPEVSLLVKGDELCTDGRYEDDLESGFMALTAVTRKALEYLQGPDTLNIDEEDPACTPSALAVLDDMAMLALVFPHDLVESAKIRIASNALKERIEILFLETCTENLPPCHRLIPLNTWRAEMLSGIVEPFRHHFPWYDLWSKAPEHAISELVSNWKEITGKEPDFSGVDMDQRLTASLLEEIRLDRPFYRELENRFLLNQKIADVVSKSISLRLSGLAGCMNTDFPIPDIVAEKGFQATACKVMETRMFSNSEKYERLLLAGFFGPDLPVEERLDLFRKIEKWMEGSPVIMPGSLTWRLKKWSRDALQSATLLKKSRDAWLERLEMAAGKMKNPVHYRDGAFQASVEKLITAQPATILETGKEMLSKLKEQIPTITQDIVKKPVETLLSSAFPQPLAIAYADSGNGRCLILQCEGGTFFEKGLVPIERFQKKKMHGSGSRWTFQGRIPAGQDKGTLIEWHCGLYSQMDNFLRSPLALDFNQETLEFSSLFSVEQDDNINEMEVRLVLVFE